MSGTFQAERTGGVTLLKKAHKEPADNMSKCKERETERETGSAPTQGKQLRGLQSKAKYLSSQTENAERSDQIFSTPSELVSKNSPVLASAL